MKKYLLTLSSLALSLGMTHAADGTGAFPAAGDDIAASSPVFGGGSVVDPFTEMTLSLGAEGSDDKSKKAEGVEDSNKHHTVEDDTVPGDTAVAEPARKKKKKVSVNETGATQDTSDDESGSATAETVAPSPDDVVVASGGEASLVEGSGTSPAEGAPAPAETAPAAADEGGAINGEAAPAPAETAPAEEAADMTREDTARESAPEETAPAAETAAAVDDKAATNTAEEVAEAATEAPAAEVASDAKPASDVVGSVD